MLLPFFVDNFLEYSNIIYMINYKLKFSTENGTNHHFVSDLHYDHNRDFIWGAPGRAYKNVTVCRIDESQNIFFCVQSIEDYSNGKTQNSGFFQ